MTAPPVLTIVVTTRNRPDTAVVTLRNLGHVAGDDVEIVVQDCSDDAALAGQLPADGRVRYHHAGRALSMTENWNEAFAQVRGDYVVFIGDDDALMPEAADLARWARRGDVAAVTYHHSAYNWPSWPIRRRAGWLLLRPYTGALTWTTPRASLAAAIARSGSPLNGLPQIYHSMIRRTLLEQVRERTGHYFDGLCPDYFASVAMATLTERCAVLDYPVSIAGYSGKSNSARNQRGGLGAHVKEFGGFTVMPGLPQPAKGGDLDVCVVDSILRAAVQMGEHELARQVPVTRAYAGYALDHPRELRELVPRFRAARRELGLGGGTGGGDGGMRELGGAMVRRAYDRGRSWLAYNLPAQVLQRRGLHALRARDVDEAAAVQRRWLDERGVRPQLTSSR